ncbi:MAG: sensor histidine kinase [Planctomycetota bacterium]|jgi:signal transduction histidine kinase
MSDPPSSDRGLLDAILSFSQRMTSHLRQPLSSVAFVREALGEVLDTLGSDTAGLWLKEEHAIFCHEMHRDSRRFLTTAGLQHAPDPALQMPSEEWEQPFIIRRAFELLGGDPAPASPAIESDGNVLIVDLSLHESEDAPGPRAPDPGVNPLRWVVLVPLDVDDERIGVLKLKSRTADVSGRAMLRLIEAISETLAISLARHASRSALRERVKELSCLYEVVQFAMVPGRSLDQLLSDIAQILPKAWQHSDVAEARIVFDGRIHQTSGFDRVVESQGVPIVRDGVHRGRVEVGYTETKLPEHDGPFLYQERKLIEAVAHEVGLVAGRLETEERRVHLEEQLRHADRLATIGQLAAGVAHELNEPLASILGFVQLALKAPDLPDRVAADLERVVASSLYARDFIRRLLTFARPEVTDPLPVDLNAAIDEVLGLFEARWAHQSIAIRRGLSKTTPVVAATPAQIRQVLVNLLTNAAHAMPQGGRLAIGTRVDDDWVKLTVEDSGDGMSVRVRKRIFEPFFTTKSAGQGTGLGLSVVHDIVTAHGGTIRVDSRTGAGTRFELEFPLCRAVPAGEAGS